MKRPFLLAAVLMATLAAGSAPAQGHPSGNARAPGALTVISTPPCAPIPAGLVSWWPGEGDAKDLADGHDGVLSGNVSFAGGLAGQAFAFAGGYVDIPGLCALADNEHVTISAWINMNSSDGRIADKLPSGTDDGFFFAVSSGRLRFEVEGMAANGGTVVPTGEFVHVAAVNDGSSLRVYLNGALDGTHNMSMTLPENASSFRLGAAQDGSAAFHGLMDEILLFDQGLTPAEITAIYQAGPSGLCPSGANLVLMKADDHDPVIVGSSVVYTLTAANNGFEPAADVMLTDNLPAGMTFIAADTDQGTCLQDQGVITCAIGTIMRGEQVMVNVTVTAQAAGAWINAAAVTSSTEDPDPSDNTVEETTTVTLVYRISGRVRTGLGLPLAKVGINLLKGSTLVASVKTSRRGIYAITGIVPGTYVLKPRKRGYVFTPRSRVLTVSGSNLVRRNFTANPR